MREEISVYDFGSLREAVDFFDSREIAIEYVSIGGAYGGSEPTFDDDPVFYWAV